MLAGCRGGSGGVVLVADILHLDKIDPYTIVVVDIAVVDIVADDIVAVAVTKKESKIGLLVLVQSPPPRWAFAPVQQAPVRTRVDGEGGWG